MKFKWKTFLATLLISSVAFAQTSNLYDLKDTWNNGSITYDAIKMVVTDTASAADSAMINLSTTTGGAFNVDKTGILTTTGQGIFGSGNSRVSLSLTGVGLITPTADVAPTLFTLNGQSAYNSATTNKNGADIKIKGGAGIGLGGIGGDVILTGGTGSPGGSILVQSTITPGAGSDLVYKLGDAAGVNKLSITDSADVEQFTVDSNGTVNALGTYAIDGLTRITNSGSTTHLVGGANPGTVTIGDTGNSARHATFSSDGNHLINSLLDAATGNEAALSLNYTTNKLTSGTVDGLVINVTETLVPSTHLPFNIKVGGVSLVDFNNVGQLTLDKAQTFGLTTGIAFGGGLQIYESAANALAIGTGGSLKWEVTDQWFGRSDGSSGAFFRQAASATLPSIVPNATDSNTGTGLAAADQLSHIAGGIEAMRLSEASSHILIKYEMQAGITCFATGGQASATQITSSYNVLGAVATAGDSCKMPAAVAGVKVVIMNNGASSADIFPLTGDNLGAGVDTAVALAAGTNITYFAVDSTNWETL